MSKPKVFVAMRHVPELAIDLLRKRFESIIYTSKYSYTLHLNIFPIYLLFLYFRFDVEICDSLLATRAEIMQKIPGKFAIFCSPSNKIDEELIKTAG